MIGFLCFLSICGLLWSWWRIIDVYDHYVDIHENDVESLERQISEAMNDTLVPLILSSISLLYNALVTIDYIIWDSFGDDTSPILKVNYYSDLWEITLPFIFLTLFFSIATLSWTFYKRITIRPQMQEEYNTCVKLSDEMNHRNSIEEKEVACVFGHYDKMITIDADYKIGYKGYKNAFYINMLSRKIMAKGQIINFDKIISCSYTDNSHIESSQIGESVSTSTINNGSMVGRAMIGGMLAGGVGAIIGGSTAKRDTISSINTTTTSHVIHNYTIIINVKDILNPVCKIPCGENEQAVHNIVGTINAIIKSR